MRADFANCSHQLLFAYTELIGPIPNFTVVVHIDVLLIADLLAVSRMNLPPKSNR